MVPSVSLQCGVPLFSLASFHAWSIRHGLLFTAGYKLCLEEPGPGFVQSFLPAGFREAAVEGPASPGGSSTHLVVGTWAGGGCELLPALFYISIAKLTQS